MKSFSYVITDAEGIHARPAGLLVRQAAKYQSAIKIEKGGKSGDAKRIFAVMGLAAKQGETVTISADGADEDTAIAELEAFMKENL
ncbi:MAG: HPr family phosphocarrier protein [Candidatus Limousia pullorum]